DAKIDMLREETDRKIAQVDAKIDMLREETRKTIAQIDAKINEVNIRIESLQQLTAVQIKKIEEQMNTHYQIFEKRFSDILRQGNRIQWLITILITLLSILITLFKFLT
ncbi:MAG: hypothetical protein NZ576_12525, partial [Bacteroidia bacterium]|nr:hypothetical protein [Bacteroidia bacterium]